MEQQQSDILIIGAGMAGLTCATRLTQAGRSVTVIDKGRGPGGRMAARRTEIAGETVSFDHGAQYFTARDASFREAAKAWEAQGVIARWDVAGPDAWVGMAGMNGPIRAMAEPLDVHWNVRAEALTELADGWFVDAGEKGFTTGNVLIAVPAEQAAELLRVADPELAQVPAAVRSEPCWAVMAAFADRLPIEPDTMRDASLPISWAARNSAKPGRKGAECWMLHASPQRSREVLHLPKDEAAQTLLADFFAQTDVAPTEPVHLDAHRWLYAMPSALAGEPARYAPTHRIGIAGDYLHSPRVEGAFLSGLALAEKVLRDQ